VPPGNSRAAATSPPGRTLENQIAEFTIQCNKTLHPYKWSYDADAEHAATSNATPARTSSPGPPDRNNPQPANPERTTEGLR
jgi:hypothetical protein